MSIELTKRLGRFNPPRPEKYKPRNYEQDTVHARRVAATLKALRPGDKVQVETREDRGRLAAFYAVAFVKSAGGTLLVETVLPGSSGKPAKRKLDAIRPEWIARIRALK